LTGFPEKVTAFTTSLHEIMKTIPFRSCSRLALGSLGLLLASCALPPAEAWRVIRQDGLIPYLAMEIKNDKPAGAPESRYLASKPEAPAAKPSPSTDGKVATVTAPSTAPVSSTPPRPVLITRGSEPVAVPAKTTEPDAPVRPVKPKAISAAEALANAPKSAPKVVKPTPAPETAAAKPKEEPKPAPAPEPKKEMAAKPAPAETKPEAPASKPTPAKTETAAAPAPKLAAPVAKADELPYGNPVTGRPGLVNSPYAGKMQLVDVTGLKPGTEVKCPYSGKLFRVPPGATATAKQAADEPTKK